MSVRDEIAKALANPDAEDWSWGGMADAVMPIVERVAREAAEAGWLKGWGVGSRGRCESSDADFVEIVRRVVGDE